MRYGESLGQDRVAYILRSRYSAHLDALLGCGRSTKCAQGEHPMARTYIVFGDIAGKLDILRVECTRCPRKGRYSVAKLVAQYGRRGNMTKWISDLKADCAQRDVSQLHERCDLICPDLPKLL